MMKVILTTGPKSSGYVQVHEILVGSGAIPAAFGTPETQHRMTRDLAPDNPLDEAALAALVTREIKLSSIDGICLALSADCDGFEPEAWFASDIDTCFVLVYCAPEIALAQMSARHQPTPDQVMHHLRGWVHGCQALIQFYHRHPGRCLLVNQMAAVLCPHLLVDQLRPFMELRAPEPESVAANGDRVGRVAMEGAMVRSLVAHQRGAQALFSELESLAHLPGDLDAVVSDQRSVAWQSYLSLAQAGEAAQQRVAEQAHSVAEMGRHLAGREQQLAALQGRLDQVVQSHGLLEADLQRAQRTVDEGLQALEQQQQANASLRAENELLFSQLQKVQAELDAHTPLPVPARQVVAQKPGGRTLTIDLREDIDGDNWYYAEGDGRWAGPASVSTLRVPAQAEGRYELTLNVVDAMDRKILAGMSLALNGTGLTLNQKGRGVAAVVTSRFSSGDFAPAAIWEFQLTFPRLVSPAQRGSADSRMLAIRLQTLQLTRIS